MTENDGDDAVDTIKDDDDTLAAEPPGGIVVGYDGSGGAGGALDLALGLAAELGAPLTVVRAWSLTSAPRPPSWSFGYTPSEDELEQAVRDELEADTRSRLAAHPGVALRLRPIHAGPARALIQASRGARMLVVGSRGRGGFRELMLGSVSDQCVRYAHCPVLVARG